MSTANDVNIRHRHDSNIEIGFIFDLFNDLLGGYEFDSMTPLYLGGSNIFRRLGCEISCKVGCGSLGWSLDFRNVQDLPSHRKKACIWE